MRIILCLNHDIMSNIALNLLREALLDHEVIIYLSRGVGKKSASVDELMFLEQKLPCDFLFPLLEELGKPEPGAYYTFRQVEKYDGMKIFYPENINSSESIKDIKDYAPDIILSVRFGQIFKEEIISIPKNGIINLHSGILPDYKGILATFQALLHGEKKVGCTLHYVNDHTIDTGDIIGCSYIDSNKDRSLLWHVSELYNGGADMIKDVLKKIIAGEVIKRTPQDLSKGNYFSLPTSDEVRDFRDLEYKIFDSLDYMNLINLYKKSV